MTSRNATRTAVRLAAAAALFACLPRASAAEPVEGVLVRLDADGRPTVAVVDAATLSVPDGSRGLIVWAAGGREQWQWLAGAWRMPATAPPAAGESSVGVLSRGPAGASDGGGGDVALLTTPLEQLGGSAITRDVGSFLSPWSDGRLLDGRVTFRRKPGRDGKLPAQTAVVRREAAEVVRVRLAEGQERLRWSEIAKLPKELADGLPPGDYVLTAEGALDRVEFTVEDPKRRDEVLRRSAELARLLGSRTHPIAVQVAVDELLSKKPQPYLADALDLLESVPDDAQTPYLRRTREATARRLEDPGQGVKVRAPEAEATGVKEIDEVRDLIAVGRWDKASKALDAIKADDAPAGRRKGALALLYRGVILAESGQGEEEAATTAFRKAIGGLKGGEAADLYRAHNNFADFLLGRAQDRLYNHAFQMAAGAERPLLAALQDWAQARAEYEAALASTATLGPGPRAAVQVNLARLYALLGEVLRTMADPNDASRRFPEGEKAAADLARQFAEQAAAAGPDKGDPLVAAAAEEVLAHLDFQAGKTTACLDDARKAGAAYQQAGSLVGAESVERLIGLAGRRAAAEAGDAAAADKENKEALKHFQIAHQLSEVLRDRYPPDRSGVTRAGFFARRAYVNEQIVDLLTAEGDGKNDVEALHYAELAKARALQDLLAGRGVGTDGSHARDLDEILHDWPKDMAALEYFLGSERAWVFVVAPGGTVKAYPLLDEKGKPLASRDLVAQVEQLLDGMRFQADRIRARLDANQGFDHEWQAPLGRLYQELIPEAVRPELRRAKNVVIVPHHILHYLPFAALVTQRDDRPRAPNQMVQPRFLLNEPFDLSYASSLTTWDLIRRRPDRPIAQAQAVGIVQIPGEHELPGVEEDLKNLKEAFGGKVGAVLTGDDATKAKVMELLGRPGLLLIGTHGWNEADRPLESFLMCMPAGGDDGLLTAADIYNADVHADLVVLSACFSGLADRSPMPGDDLFGLQRALLQSGARTVVSGLWDVNDRTGPELIGEFMRRVAKGEPAAAALARSQRTFVEQCRKTEGDIWMHPYFWAVYTAAGDERTH